MYDWANSAYSTILITIVVVYIKNYVLEGDSGTIAYGYVIGFSMMLAALLSPVVGAIADVRATKHRWLLATAVPGAIAAVVMGAAPTESTWVVIAAFFLASLGFELALGIYNGFLPEISTEETVNRISARGFALGYIGGALPLVLTILVIMQGGALGLPDHDALERDFHGATEATFELTVPDGSYEVRVLAGDATAARDEYEIEVEGRSPAKFNTAAGEFVTRTDLVEVADGRLTVKLIDRGGDDPLAVIAGLELRDDGGALILPPLDFGREASSVAEGALAIVPGHDYAKRMRADLEKDGLYVAIESEGEESAITLPDEIEFGWTSGDVVARDRVIPIRLRIGIVMMGLWWGLFSLPTLLILRDRGHSREMLSDEVQAARNLSWLGTAAAGIKSVGNTLRNVRMYRTLALFLVGYLIYNEGVQTVISQASQFAIDVLSMGATELALLVLMIQFLAIPGAILVGWLSDKLGRHRALMSCLVVWMLLLVSAYFVTERWQFWIMGAVLAMVMGGIQAVSRAVMAYMTPQAKTAQFFGFYNLSGASTAFIRPIIFASLSALVGPHMSITSLLVFFVIGGAIVLRLDFEKGRRESLAA